MTAHANTYFKDFSKYLHQDCDLYGNNWDEIIATSLRMLGKEKSLGLVNYIDKIISEGLDDKTIEKIWNESLADIYFQDRSFYKEFLLATRAIAERYIQH